MTTTPADDTTYSTDEDVKNALGGLRDRLPSWVVISQWRRTAQAEALDALAKAYPTKIPTFTGPGLTLVGLAEARFAAAGILDAIRVNLPDLGDQPEQMRASAIASLIDGVPGYPPGSAGTVPGDGDGDGGTGTPYGSGPRVSSFTPASAFPDPYAPLRDAGLVEDLRWL